MRCAMDRTHAQPQYANALTAAAFLVASLRAPHGQATTVVIRW
jgi:hypothetical protein